MKKIIMILMMVTVVLFSKDLEREPAFIKYKMKVLDYSQQVLLQYSQDLSSIYATNKEIYTYMRVCILVKYNDVIIKGYKLNPIEPMDTVAMVFDTGLKKCTRKNK